MKLTHIFKQSLYLPRVIIILTSFFETETPNEEKKKLRKALQSEPQFLLQVSESEIWSTCLAGAELSLTVNSPAQRDYIVLSGSALYIVWSGIFHFVLHLHLLGDTTQWQYFHLFPLRKQHGCVTVAPTASIKASASSLLRRV